MAEVSVRYVHLSDEIAASMGSRPMLGLRGKKLAHVVGIELNRVYSKSIPVQWFDKAPTVSRHNQPYPIERYLAIVEGKINSGEISASPKALEILKAAHDPDNFDDDGLENLSDDPPTNGASTTEDPPETPNSEDGWKTSKGKIRIKRAREPAKPRQAAPIKPPKARQPAATGTEKRGRGRPPGSAGTGLIAVTAKELKCDPAHLRKACRAAGLKAPYTDPKAIKKAWKDHGDK